MDLISRWRDTTEARAVSFLAGLLTGLVAGTVLGVLFAPHRGDITRRKIRRTMEDTTDRVREKAEALKA